MNAIHASLDSGTDPRLLARQVVDYLRAMLLMQMGNTSQVDLAANTRLQAEKLARAFSQPDILRMINAFNNAAVDQRGGWQPSLPLELALAEMVEMPVPTGQSRTQPGGKPPVESKAEKQVSKVSMEPQKPIKDASPTVLYQTAVPEKKVEDSGNVTLDQVTKAWKQISASIKPQSPSLSALLNSCRPLEIKNNVLVIGFANDLVRSKMDTPEQIEITRKAVVKMCGGDLSIKCVVSNAKQAPPANVKADGMVAAALKKGGEIVDIQE
jgi:DNA polymerase-3 subunit gamma/tau